MLEDDINLILDALLDMPFEQARVAANWAVEADWEALKSGRLTAWAKANAKAILAIDGGYKRSPPRYL